jgi:hypothetical protein
MIWLGVIAIVIIACITPALADTLTCSTFAGVTTCLGEHGTADPAKARFGP